MNEIESDFYDRNSKYIEFITGTKKVIKLYNMDCTIGMDFFPDHYFDVVLTSPPYNIGTSYSLYDDKIPRSEYLEWIEKVAIKIKQKIKKNGSFFLNIGASPTNPWGPFEIASLLRHQFSLQNVIHRIKSIYIENKSYGHRVNLNVGHFKPIQGHRFLNDNHEYIFHFTKSGDVQLDRLSIGVPYKDKGNINRWKLGGNGIRCRGNTWYFPYETIRSRDKDRPHPATFPVELAEKCILLHGVSEEMNVLDPFMGMGHTSLACNKIGVNCVGFEIDKNYYESNIRLLKSKIFNKTLDSWKNI
jgi:site-specific DNA-methyltransferase (adenine-specific)